MLPNLCWFCKAKSQQKKRTEIQTHIESLWVKQKGASLSLISPSWVAIRKSHRIRYWPNMEMQLWKLKMPLFPIKFVLHPHQTTCQSTAQTNIKHPSVSSHLPHLPIWKFLLPSSMHFSTTLFSKLQLREYIKHSGRDKIHSNGNLQPCHWSS